MKYFSLTVSLVFFLCSTTVFAICPDTSKSETTEDCPWAQVTRDLNAVTDFKQIRQTIQNEIPGFMHEIDRDAHDRHLIHLWGLSSNIDASQITTGIKTIPVNLLEYFVSLWHVPYNTDFTQGYAGLNHTYGYLFSNLQTPYGYKRARYVQGEIEAGLNLPSATFSGLPPHGTLFTNLTEFIAPIAFRDHKYILNRFYRAGRLDRIERVNEITHYDYSALRTKRLVEVAQGNDYYLEIRTDIVPFIATNTKGTDTSLLIYSIDFRKPNESPDPKLITAFPVDDASVTGIFNPKTLGDKQQIQLNYNAVLPKALTPSQMVGRRYIAND